MLHPLIVVKNSRGYDLVAGHGRLKAARELGTKTVRCLVVDAGPDDVRRELAWIDENLVRAALEPAQRDAHITRRIALLERLQPETTPISRKRQGGKKAGKYRPVSAPALSAEAEEVPETSTAMVAVETGKSPRETRAARQRYTAAAEPVWAAYEDGNLKQKQVDLLVGLSKELQRQVLPEVIGKSVVETRDMVKATKTAARRSSTAWAGRIASCSFACSLRGIGARAR